MAKSAKGASQRRKDDKDPFKLGLKALERTANSANQVAERAAREHGKTAREAGKTVSQTAQNTQKAIVQLYKVHRGVPMGVDVPLYSDRQNDWRNDEECDEDDGSDFDNEDDFGSDERSPSLAPEGEADKVGFAQWERKEVNEKMTLHSWYHLLGRGRDR
ncbi:MAG: hypothetical protein SGARI_001598, partial [Bacillariaceae sp.]